MKWFKRAWLSIIRRPLKSSMLFLISLGMTTLLAGALAIVSTSETITEEIKTGLGSEVVVTNELYPWEGYTNEDVYSTLNKFQHVMNRLLDDERINEGEYHVHAGGIYTDFFRELSYTLTSTNIVKGKDFRNGYNQLIEVEGNRFFTEEEIENGEMVIMTSYSLKGDEDENTNEFISSGLCDLNNYVTLTVPIKYETIENEDGIIELKPIGYDFKVKVVGIFNNYAESNIIYIPQKTFDKIIANANEYSKELELDKLVDLTIGFANFKLKDSHSLESFDKDAKEMLANVPNSEAFAYVSSNDSYDRNAGPVENLESIAKLILISSIVCTIIVITLVGIFFISDRKNEIGIYVSMGEKKGNVIAQIVFEMLLVTTLAITLSSVTGVWLSKGLSDYMLDVQRYTERQQDFGQYVDIPIIYRPAEDVLTTLTRDDVMDSYEVKPSIEYFAILFIVGELTVLVSGSISMIYLIKLKPKEILI